MSITIALAGNPNCGKTTLFNALTGSNQYVGNWPGVTVEKKEGKLKGHKDVKIADLPGIYSLSPYTLEEVVARNYLIGERPDVILNIIDGTNLERNLYLTTQVIELGIPVVLAVNMMDAVEKTGSIINLSKLSEATGCPTVGISALKNRGVMEAAEKAIEVAEHKAEVALVHKFDEKVESALTAVEDKLPGDVPAASKRYFAVKLLEGDNRIRDDYPSLPDCSADMAAIEKEMDDDAESVIANERYSYIASIISSCYEKKSQQKLTTSDKIDRIVTNRWLALPIFAGIMFLVYYISITKVGTPLTDFVNDNIFADGFSFFGHHIPAIPEAVRGGLESIGTADWLIGLIVDAIIGGVGAVLGFLPQMLVFFLLLGFLEACGYMARVAFILDRIFRKFGLSGRSFIPILIGTGCGVPGVMASRTIENDRDRKMTIMTTTFIPCGAKLPVIALIAGAIFKGAAWVGPSAYFVGITAIIISGIMLKKTKLFAGEPAPFVMELPAYHWPTVGTVLRSMWERGWSFVKKAGTIILLSSIAVWFLQGFGWEAGHFGMVEDLDNSVLSKIGHVIAVIFIPLGWGQWKMAVASVTGLIAKENVISTFGQLFHFAGELSDNGDEIWGRVGRVMTPLAGYSFLVFNLLCAPCFAAMGAIKREMNNIRWFWIAIGYQCIFAYVIALCIYRIGMLTQGHFSVWTIIAILLVIYMVYLLVRKGKEADKLELKVKTTK